MLLFDVFKETDADAPLTNIPPNEHVLEMTKHGFPDGSKYRKNCGTFAVRVVVLPELLLLIAPASSATPRILLIDLVTRDVDAEEIVLAPFWIP
jgi:hypothetical protein